jgi:hypothetical protein
MTQVTPRRVFLWYFGSGAICEIVNHQGHQGTRRKQLGPKAFVILRALGGSGFHRLHRETAPTGLSESLTIP